MNRIYRSIWNATTRTFVAASENAAGRGSKASPTPTSMARQKPFGLKAAAACMLLAFGSNAWALPAGGVVSAGGASIATNAGTTTVGQTSQNVAINWQSFSIGQTEAVRFVQPNSSSVALNRVLGSDPSSILGSLSANGKVFLVNPNGILFGQGAQVNVGGLVASTLNIGDADFMAGRYNFTGNGTGSVQNQGTINADGGYVALLGANVSNQGVISARLGTIVLAAGSAMTLDMAGDGLLNVAVNQGAVNALVENGGMIRADGGHVLLTALAAGNLLQSAVNNTGVIQAQTIGNHEGTIRLMGDMAVGTMAVGGTLDASAPNGGNGGFIETSAAHVSIANDVRVTTAAPLGQAGMWLIDPVDFVVGSAPGNNISGATLSGQLVTGNITITTVAGAGAGNGDIIINDAITWNGAAAPGASTTLTLNALRDVNINNAITATNGNLVVCCGRDVNLAAAGAISTTRGSILLSAGNNVNQLGAVTAVDGNIAMCAGHDVNVTGALTITNGSLIPAQSLASLGVANGLTLRSGITGTGPGVASGTVTITGAGNPVTVTNTPAVVEYNPVSYTAPTNYVPQFTVTGALGSLTTRMLVYPGGADRVFNGTTTAVFTALQGAPAGVTLNPGGTANFDSATAGTNKLITFSGFTLGGVNAANFALPVACCGPAVTRVLGNITPAIVAPPPDDVVPPIVTPIVVATLDLATLDLATDAPEIQNILGSEFPRNVAGLNLSVVPHPIPPVQLAIAPPVVVPVVVPVAPVVVPPPVPPQIYVPPVRERKPDRN